MYKNILVPVDPGEPTHAADSVELAKSMLLDGGSITIISVLEIPPAYVANFLPPGQADDVLAKEEKRLASELGTLGASSFKVVHGHAAQAILDEASATQADCIIIASHRPGARHFFLGSTAGRVVRRAKCSVHVLRSPEA